MRFSSHGVIEMDLCASISYHCTTGAVHNFLHGCNSEQQAQVQAMLAKSSSLARHPLLLPVLLTELKLDLVEQHSVQLWNKLVQAETLSGQTNYPAINNTRHPRAHKGVPPDKHKSNRSTSHLDFEDVTIEVLGVLQITAYAESHAKSLLLSIEEIQTSIGVVSRKTKTSNAEVITRTGLVLSERLDFLAHRTQVVINNVQFYEKRAQAQQTAVRVCMRRRS